MAASFDILRRMSDTLKTQIKEAIVKSLRLSIAPQEIQDDIPLFGEGLGLDSVDALQLVLELERKFDVVVGDEEVGNRVLRSVNSIAEFVSATRGAAS
jgi:acyl carrier protein